MKKYVVFFSAILCLMAGTAAPYSRITSSTGVAPKWLTTPIPVWINEKGYPPITNGSDIDAVLAAFQTWESVPSAAVQFDYRGKTAAHIASYDGINMISFTDNVTALSSSAIAVTLSYFTTSQGRPVFNESDIIFSTTFGFSTSGESDKFDIQGILTHEVGHFLGLDHAAMVSSVMVPFGRMGVLDQRTLQYDDIAAISEVYPNPSANPAVGEIQGFIMNGTVPVFGANIVAVDPAGTAWVSTLSQPTGSFDLKFLPPGTYKVYAEPLNQGVTEQNLSTSWYHNLNTNFGATYFGNVFDFNLAGSVQVNAGQITAGTVVQVLPASATGLNLTRPAYAPRIPRNASGTLTVGGADITAGTQFSTFTSDISLGAPTFGGSISSAAPTSAAMNLSVLPNAALGAKNITVTRDTDASIISGGIVVVDLLPSPVEVLPAIGPSGGNTNVTIFGSNFRPGAQVSFAGLQAPAVTVVDSGTILATTPPGIPGGANVLVVNTDGTNGVISRGFTYLPPTPTITSLTPASGPPGTVVTISGTDFDNRVQNVSVRFDGTPARVNSAGASTVTAIVPFGATSGPVTVSIFGVTATGDVNFDVTAPLVSANHPTDTYNFTDASASSGGSVLVFQGPNPIDDGLATVSLPFTFSLFNDTYLAGSPITISTNGWISLEAIDDPYGFENGSLPGTSAVDSMGVARQIPPSLIAPFHDDLALIPNVSFISTKVTGTSPNRQFIVEFTRLTILDQNGRDQNASVTFEAVLFEGSNDIQFIYQNVSGPRSDGSSATIGLQNLRRDTAVLTSFDQPKVHSGLFLTYRFTTGTYTTSEDTFVATPAATSFIPYAPQSSTQFSGISLYAPSAMSIVLKAFDANGNVISGGGIQNPITLMLSAGEQYSRLVSELFGLTTFNGWIQVEASATGLGVSTATGSWDLSEIDGSGSAQPVRDFLLFHAGATAFLVNPSPIDANLTIIDLTTSITRTLVIAPWSQLSVPVTGISRIQSSEALVSVERFGSSPKLGIAPATAVSPAQTSFTIPAGVTGGGYITTVYLVNLTNSAADATVAFGGASKVVHLNGNSTASLSLASLLQIPPAPIQSDAVRIESSQPLLAELDIESPTAVVSIGERAPAMDLWLPNAVQGNGLFTGLAIASGPKTTNVTVEVYPPTGGIPQSAKFVMNANQQISKVLGEIVSSVGSLTGGYIHIHADQPVWAWEIYGSATILASGPPF